METLNAEEAKDILTLSGGRDTAVYARLKVLKPGQGIKVMRAEWKTNYPPTRIARRLEKKLGWKFRTGRLLDNSGWLLHRLS